MEYLSPGVYVEEIDTGAKPIEGVSTSTAGMVGVTERGPLNRPILITSFGDFRRWFGELLDASNFGAHSYLPSAVAGFFTNGGQRTWITRVLRPEATRAALQLRDRGTVGGFAGQLLRISPRGTGTAVNGPPLTVLDDGTGLNPGDDLRIGDGGSAEYRGVAAAPTATTTLPLAFPLVVALAQGDPGVGVARIPDATAGFTNAGGDFTLTAVACLDITITETTAGDAAALPASGTRVLLEVGAAPHAEYRFADIAAVTATTADLTLEHPLEQPFDVTTAVPVTFLDPADPAPAACSLTEAALAGALLLHVDTPIGAKPLLLGGPAGAEQALVVGSMERLALTGGTFEDYPAQTTLIRVAHADDDRQIDATAGGTTFNVTVGGVDRLVPGMTLEVRPPAAAPIKVTLTAVDATAGTVTVHPALAALAANIPVSVIRTTSAPADAGSVSVPAAQRLGLAAGDVLRVGTELAVVAALAGDPDPANPGLLLLESPLRTAAPAGTPVVRQVITSVSGVGIAHHIVRLALSAAVGDAAVVVTHGGGLNAGDMFEVRRPTGLPFYQTLAAAPVALTPVDVLLDRDVRRNHGLGDAVVARTPLIDVEAFDPGTWGNRLEVAVRDEPRGLVTGTVMTNVHGPAEIELSTLTGVEPGTVLELLDAAGASIGPPLKVSGIDFTTGHVTLAANLSATQMAASGSTVRSREFGLRIRLLRPPDPRNPLAAQQPLDEEEFLNLSMDPRHSRYFERVVGDIDGEPRLYDGRPEGNSWLVRVRDITPSEAVRPGPEALEEADLRGRRRPAYLRMEGGDDMIGLLGDADYIGIDATDPLDRTGLHTLRNRDDVSIVAVPGRTGAQLQQAVVTHCEEMRYRFAILDGPPPPADAIADVIAQRQQFDTKYAALYHPWLLVPHPYPPFPTTAVIEYPVPPSGHMAGIYARVDVERGVHKAPANEVVRGVIGLRQQLSKREQDVLNPGPTNINVIRDFRRDNRAIRSYGGRVISSDPDWKYVNVRRLVIFIEASIDRGLQWVVFEPNAEPLWARVRRTIGDFLTTVWRNGALEGTAPEEAYFVRCDRSTMTQTDIDLGRLIAVVGVAPVKPAEFVIIRIGLWTAHADT